MWGSSVIRGYHLPTYWPTMDHVKWKRINCVVTADETSGWHLTDTRVCTLPKTWHVVPYHGMLVDQETLFPAFSLFWLFPNFSAPCALFIIYQNVILPFPRSYDSNNAFWVIWDVMQWNIASSVIKMGHVDHLLCTAWDLTLALHWHFGPAR